MHNHDRGRYFNNQVVIMLVTLILAGAAVWSIGLGGKLLLLLIPSVLLGFHYYEALGTSWRAAWVGLTLAIVVVFSISALQAIYLNIIHPPEWDMLAFWLNGRVAAQGLNFYNPELYYRFAQSFNSNSDFITASYFRYPPPTMLLFMPLGWFDISTATALWYLANVIVLVLNIIMLWKIFLRKSSLIGLAVVAALVCLLHSTLSTIWYGQTNFILLLMLLLFWRNREGWSGGVWLAIGIFTKPVLASLLLYSLLQRKLRLTVMTITTLIIISLLSIAVFGWATFLSYFTIQPAVEVPGFVYTEIVNQSLLATILRLTQYDFSNVSPLTQPLFIVIALLLTSITAWLVFRLEVLYTDWALALTLSLALLLYPGTLEHYAVLLIVPLLLFWMHRQELPGGIWIATAFITLIYALVAYQGGTFVFFAIALNWLALAGIGAVNYHTGEGIVIFRKRKQRKEIAELLQ